MISAFLFSLVYHIIKTRPAWQAARSRGLPVSTRRAAVMLRASLEQLLSNFGFNAENPTHASFHARSPAHGLAHLVHCRGCRLCAHPPHSWRPSATAAR